MTALVASKGKDAEEKKGGETDSRVLLLKGMKRENVPKKKGVNDVREKKGYRP